MPIAQLYLPMFAALAHYLLLYIHCPCSLDLRPIECCLSHSVLAAARAATALGADLSQVEAKEKSALQAARAQADAAAHETESADSALSETKDALREAQETSTGGSDPLY